MSQRAAAHVIELSYRNILSEITHENAAFGRRNQAKFCGDRCKQRAASIPRYGPTEGRCHMSVPQVPLPNREIIFHIVQRFISGAIERGFSASIISGPLSNWQFRNCLSGGRSEYRFFELNSTRPYSLGPKGRPTRKSVDL